MVPVFLISVDIKQTNILTYFGGAPPKCPIKNQFFESLNQGARFFDISRYLTDKYFEIVWGYQPSGDPPKINF